MRMKHILSAGFGALALGLVATTAQAAPVGGLANAVETSAADTGLVEKVHWYGRRHHHRWHYGYRPYYYGYYGYYGYYRPYYWRYRHHHHWY